MSWNRSLLLPSVARGKARRAGLRAGFAVSGVAMLALVGSMTAAAQSFVLSQNGKSVGSANLSLKQAAGGFSSTSSAKVNMPGLNYSISVNETLDGQYQLRTAKLNGSVNGTAAAVATSLAGQQFAMRITANGSSTNTNLAAHAHAVFFPDFDPGSLQILVSLGAINNNRDIWVLIPKQSGSTAPIKVATKADEQGTLDGQTIAVHHLTLTLDTDTIEVFSSPANELLQAEWPGEGFALARQGFRIKPPAHPTAPPPKPPADQQNQQAPPAGAQPPQ